MSLPARVKIVEVSPRDGLQNEKQIIPTAMKLELIQRLIDSGVSAIEATSFVSPKWVPQLADHADVMRNVPMNDRISYSVFVPNMKGLEAALAVGVKEIAVFTTPSETFCQRNINCSVRDSLKQIEMMVALAKQHSVRVRAYISCVLGCPYEGEIKPILVADLAEKLFALGCDEISLGDTIGVGTAGTTKKLLEEVLKKSPKEKLAVHFHDTYGQALVNIYVALGYGISVVDASVAGLGGCPYAKGASGNVATEKVVYMLHGLGIETGIDWGRLSEVKKFVIEQFLPINSPSSTRGGRG